MKVFILSEEEEKLVKKLFNYEEKEIKKEQKVNDYSYEYDDEDQQHPFFEPKIFYPGEEY